MGRIRVRADDQSSSGTDPLALLTIEQLAELFEVHPRTVRRMLARGDLAAVYLSDTTMRVRRIDAEQLLATRSRRSSDAESRGPRTADGRYSRREESAS